MKTITEIKEATNQLARRAAMGQQDDKTLTALFNDVVNYLARQNPAEATLSLQQTTAGVIKPKRGRKSAKVAKVTVDPETTSIATGNRTIPTKFKMGRGVTVGQAGTINTGVTVGSAPASPAGRVTVGGRTRG